MQTTSERETHAARGGGPLRLSPGPGTDQEARLTEARMVGQDGRGGQEAPRAGGRDAGPEPPLAGPEPPLRVAPGGTSFTEENLRRFGGELRARRKARGWNGKEMAAAVGISPQYLSHLENAYSTEERNPVSPSVPTLEAISSALGWPMLDIWRVLGAVSPGELEGRTRRSGMYEDLRRAIDELEGLPDDWKGGPIEVFRLLVAVTHRQLEIHGKQLETLREQAGRVPPPDRGESDRGGEA